MSAPGIFFEISHGRSREDTAGDSQQSYIAVMAAKASINRRPQKLREVSCVGDA